MGCNTEVIVKDTERDDLVENNLSRICVHCRTVLIAVLTCRGPVKARKFWPTEQTIVFCSCVSWSSLYTVLRSY
jgi:RNase P subunit RPR2